MLSISIPSPKPRQSFSITHNGKEYLVDPVPFSQQSSRFRYAMEKSQNSSLSLSDPFCEVAFDVFVNLCEGSTTASISKEILCQVFTISEIWDAKEITSVAKSIIDQQLAPSDLISHLKFLITNNLPMHGLDDLIFRQVPDMMSLPEFLELPFDVISFLILKSNPQLSKKIALFCQLLPLHGTRSLEILSSVDFSEVSEATILSIDRAFEIRHRSAIYSALKSTSPPTKEVEKQIKALKSEIDFVKNRSQQLCERNEAHIFGSDLICIFCGRQACSGCHRTDQVHSFDKKGLCILCHKQRCEESYIHCFEPNGICGRCGAQYCCSLRDAHQFELGICVGCGKEKCSEKGTHIFNRECVCVNCGKQGCTGGGTHEFNEYGMCVKCRRERCCDGKIHVFNETGECILCHNQLCRARDESGELHHFNSKGSCSGCKLRRCQGLDIHKFGINGFCEICKAEYCEISKDEHSFDQSGKCKRCGKERCHDMCCHIIISDGSCAVCLKKVK